MSTFQGKAEKGLLPEAAKQNRGHNVIESTQGYMGHARKWHYFRFSVL
jgi:hypothetical protein